MGKTKYEKDSVEKSESKKHKKDRKRSSSRHRSRSRDRKNKRDDSDERRRRRYKDEDSRRNRKDRRSSSSSSKDSRKKHKSKKRRRASSDSEERKERERKARLAKVRALALLHGTENELDEGDDHPLEDLVYDEQQKLKEQLRLFEESGLEGKKVVIEPIATPINPENDPEQNGTSKSELSQRDGTKVNNTSNIRENELIEPKPVDQNPSAKSENTLQSILAEENKEINEAPIVEVESIKVQKSEFVSLDSPSQEPKQNFIAASLPSINLTKSQPRINKFNDVFKSHESSPKRLTEPLTHLEHNNETQEDFDEDPLDAYMKTIKYDAAEQDDLGCNEEDEDKPVQNVISIDEILNMNNDRTESYADQSNMDSDEDEMEIDKEHKSHPIDDEKYYREFINRFRKERATERQERFFNDDDKYLEEFAGSKESGADDYLEKQKKQTEKRELLLSSKMQRRGEIETFTKNFYIEPKEISDMTEEEVEKYRKELGDVTVRGIDWPRPIINWYQWGLTQRILAVINKKEFSKPTPIQCQAIPAIMGGRDIIGIAETGSGKTLAYLLPMFRHILNQRPVKEGEGMIGLIMAPTRELAQQIFNEARAFTKVLNLNIVWVYGGAEVGSQLSQLKRTAEIVVWTPGRMIDVLTTNGGKFTNLHRVTYLVLDEADRMLDMGFEPQISRIIGGTRDDRQTVMFSATFPKSINNLAKRILTSPLEIVVGNRGQACKSIEQYVRIVEEEDKLALLTHLIDEWISEGSIIIFVDSQKEADDLFKHLYELKYELFVLHGGIDHIDREYTISDFKKGLRKVMVATSIAARGLDIKAIRVVINYKCPNHMEDYIHRIGRTGRAGSPGTAYTFITQDEAHYAGDLIKALKTSEQPVDEELINFEEEYQKKIKEGEIERKKKYSVNNGRGFDFTEEERKKFAESKKNAELGLYAVDPEDVSDSEINIKNVNDKQSETTTLNDYTINELLRDSKAKQIAKEAAVRATKELMIKGTINEETLKQIDKAIVEALSGYTPQSKIEKGIEQAIRVRDSFEDRENEKNNHFIAELEINDYPQSARLKVWSRDFLSSIYDLTGWLVSVRGTYFEAGKNAPIGQRKQYLFIEGSSRNEVATSYKECKRIIEENAASCAAMGLGGSTGRYNVV